MMSSSVDPDGYGVQTNKTVIGWLARPDLQESPATQRKHRLYRRMCFASAVVTAIAVLVLLGCLAYFFLFQSEPEVIDRPDDNQTYTDPINENDNTSSNASWTAMQLKQYMDFSISPCDDFYQYACGGWLGDKDIQRIPRKISLASKMEEALDQQLIKLLRQLPSERDPPHRLQTKRYFLACSNTGRLEQRGLKPFLDFLNNAAKFPLMDSTWNENHFGITKASAILTKIDMNPIFEFHAKPETKNSTRFLISRPDIPIMEEKAVKKWLMFTFKELGVNTANGAYGSAVSKILEYEKNLNKIAKESDDFIFLTDVLSLQSREKMLKWEDYFKKIGVNTTNQTFAIKHSSYFENLQKVSTDKRTVMNFVLRQILNLTLCLGPRFKPVEAFVASQVEPDRQRVCVSLARKTLPDQLARLYVDEVHCPKSDVFAEQMVNQMKDIISNKSAENQFFDAAASSTAASEVNLIQVKAGHMEYLLDIQALNNIFMMDSSSEFFESHLAFQEYRFNETFYTNYETNSWLSKHSPLDLDIDYQPIEHYLTLPAAFLQPPVMNSSWPSSMKYGALGTYLGRVLANIFLDVLNAGSQPPNEQETKAADCFIGQYSRYVYEGYQINGRESLKENILDYEGLALGFEAYVAYLASGDKQEPAIPGLNLSHQQLFFLAFAQRQCQHIPTEMSEAEITEGRLPNKLRVLGSLKNSKEFAEVFKCKPGSPMNPVSKCRFI